jgi:hypothetical protein
LDLTLLSQIAQVLRGISVVAAVVFGVVQVRHFGRQRRDAAAVELMRSLQDKEFTRAFRLIYALPEGIRARELRARGEEYEDAAFGISARFETLGLLVFRGSIPFHLVEDLVGGAVVGLWRRFRPWMEDVREEQAHRQLWEWFQWMAERLEERGRTEQAPAYERFRDWSPRG